MDNYNETLNEFISEIAEEINFRNGDISIIYDEHKYNGLMIDAAWKRNIHLLLYGFYGSIIFYVTRNGEQVSNTHRHYSPIKYKDKLIATVNHLIREIENGDFDHKKTESEKIHELISERRLTSYMNNTKWREFIHAMTKEMSIDIPYGYKTLFEEKGDEVLCVSSFDIESFNSYDFKSLEWVKLKPKFFEHKHRGMLLDDEKIPIYVEEEFVRLMRKYSIPYQYDEENKVYIIYGYK